MAWSAVSSAVTTIGELIAKEAISLWGVKEQVDSLQRELKLMQSFLKDADSRQDENEMVRIWVSEIRELAYDAEDVIEDFALKIGFRRRGGFSNFVKRSACVCKEGWILYKTKSKIDKIIGRITTLRRQLQTYGIRELRDGEESSSSYTRRESRRSYPRIIEDYIVGLDDDIQKLVSILVEEESQHWVVSICGRGGLGKTTLAKKVYHHSQVRSYFNCWAWVYVSQQCQKRRVWEDILFGLISSYERGTKLNDGEVAEKLFNFLKEKKCLVILDDICSIEDWNEIKDGFPMRETNSKILLTSRNKEVVSHADRQGYLYELECLKEEESWSLFQKIAFLDKDCPDSRVDETMEELGKSIVRHCAGLPLAIIVLGGILATRNSLDEWQMVSNSVKSYMKRGKGQITEDVLALSYADLPPYLKPCFLYLSHFPQDYEIHAQRLIQLWAAEGIVSSKQEEENGGELAEDVAESYLVELAKRCMIEVRKKNVITFKIKTFHMHDRIRDLCLSKAKQENFLFVMDKSITHSNDQNVLLPTICGVRRVAVHHSFGIQHINDPHLRSLFVFHHSFFSLDSYGERNQMCCVSLARILPNMGYVFNNFKLLRVLDYEVRSPIIAQDELSSNIGNLIHLRFLSLRDIYFFWSLPSSLGNLRCLLTLDLRAKRLFATYVPNVLWRMEQLRHLYLPKDCRFCKGKLLLCTLKNLQTLVNFSTSICYVEDLLNMTNLRVLKIRLPFSITDLKEGLEMNHPILASKYLQSLSIRGIPFYEILDARHLAHLLSSCANVCELRLKANIRKLPEHCHFSSNTAYIHISRSHLEEDPMSTLEKLPNLRILELENNVFIGREMVCSAQCFPELDSLSLKQLYNLEKWKVDEGAMPALRHLRIHGCSRLKKLPDGLRSITTLQELKIESMPREFKDKLVGGGDDFYIVQHVPSIIFHHCDQY